MTGIYRQRHPDGAVFYRVLFHYFDKFLLEYESRFEYDMVISGRQSVETAENCDGFVASTKRKFLSYYRMEMGILIDI